MKKEEGVVARETSYVKSLCRQSGAAASVDLNIWKVDYLGYLASKGVYQPLRIIVSDRDAWSLKDY
jgi:hypothetical protein